MLDLIPNEPVPPVIRIFLSSNIIQNLGIRYNNLTLNRFELLIINNVFIIIFGFIVELVKENITGIPLETFPTKNVDDDHVNGKLTVIWRDWDNILKNSPKNGLCFTRKSL